VLNVALRRQPRSVHSAPFSSRNAWISFWFIAEPLKNCVFEMMLPGLKSNRSTNCCCSARA
jgi:hypothetical protein